MKSSFDYSTLPTEKNNPLTRRIDEFSIQKTLIVINREDASVASAVKNILPSLEKAVQMVVKSLKNGGRLFFVGAGTSGRLGIMEAAECPPTFNTPPSMVQAFMAGGKNSVFRSKEGAEDNGPGAVRLIRRHVKPGDVVVGIAASGVTAFVNSALKEARQRTARTVLITCHPGVRKRLAEFVIAINTGPEVISGSTRLKAGTATKLVLNSLTVASMIQLGKVYGNRMVDLQPRSRKLTARAIHLISKLGRISVGKAKSYLKKSGGNAKTAIVMARLKCDRSTAIRRLRAAEGQLYRVIGRV